MRLLVATLLLALLAGCSSPPAETASLPADGSPAAQPAPVWKSTPVSGEFTTSSNLAPVATGAVQTLAVPSGAKRVFFNLTLDEMAPTGTSVRFDPPSCTEDFGCNKAVQSSGGKVSFEATEDVEGGDWTASFFAPVGAQKGSFTGEVNALVQPKAPKTS